MIVSTRAAVVSGRWVCLGPAARGVVWLTACAALFAGMGALVRIIVVDYGANIFWVGWVRFLIGALAMLVPGLCGVWRLRIVNRRAFIARGFFGALGQFMLFVVIAYVGLGRGTVLAYLMGVVGAVSGIFILRERPRPVAFAAVGGATVGVLLSCRAGIPAGWEWLGLGAALGSGLALTFIRKLRRTDSSPVIFLSQGIFGTVLLLPFILFAALPTAPRVWGLILLLCALDIGGQMCLNQGLGRLPIARGAALMMLTPVLSLILGVVCFREVLAPLQWLGCGLVLAASLAATVARAPDVDEQ